MSLNDSEILEALHGIRVGCVRYLNARPLIEPLIDLDPQREILFEHPSRLAAALSGGRLDIALIPVYEALRHPEYPVVDNVAIASRGEVWSVFVAWREQPITEISLDPASLTSANLCRLLFTHRVENPPCLVPQADASPSAARLLIGNQAIDFRHAEGDRWHYLDLGEEWYRRTGRPFVFAAWVARAGLPGMERIAEAFRALKERGLVQLETIVARHAPRYPAGFVDRYLREHIRFDLGAEEKAGIGLFRELLIDNNQLQPSVKEKPFLFA